MVVVGGWRGSFGGGAEDGIDHEFAFDEDFPDGGCIEGDEAFVHHVIEDGFGGDEAEGVDGVEAFEADLVLGDTVFGLDLGDGVVVNQHGKCWLKFIAFGHRSVCALEHDGIFPFDGYMHGFCFPDERFVL